MLTMSHKRLFLLVSLLAFLALMLAACGRRNQTPTPAPTAQAEAPVQAPAATQGDASAETAANSEAAGAETTGAEDTSDRTYPFQYGTLAEYEAATGNTITQFNESPLLAQKVANGELPPVEERLPKEPVVVQPLFAVGEYGGELAGPATSPTCCGWDEIEVRLQKLFTIGPDLVTIIPNIAKGYEISDDQTTYTIYLREGHRWSDGEPFTAEDFRFYYEDVVSNPELSPVPPSLYLVGGELAKFEVIDETTVRYTFAEPNPGFIVALGSEFGNRGFLPAHYFKQFHIDYNPDANTLAEEQGYADWVELFNAKKVPYNYTWNLGAETDPYAPTLNTFVFAREDSFGNKYYERNPYFFKVDVAGNQLPYTDSVRRILVEDLQVQDLKAIAGEYTHHGWGKLLSVPTYRENEEAGNYRTVMVPYERGNEYAIMFNFTVEDPVLREIFWDPRFRQAMSLAINREEINQLVYFGLATPSQAAPTPNSLYYEPWMTDYYAEYDPERANQLLDEMGLDQRDASGYRLRPDGETLFLNFQVSVPEEAWQKIGELVTDYWNAVGVKTNYKIIDVGLYNELRDGNAVQLAGWALDITDIEDISNGLGNLRPYWGARASGHPWQEWLLEQERKEKAQQAGEGTEAQSQEAGEEEIVGEEPPDEIKELWELGEQYLALPYRSEEQIAVGKEFYRKAFEPLYMIGTIQRPPQPLLFKKNLCNTPPEGTQGVWSWSYRQWVLYMPEQWYFASDGECP
uniref:Solute-binding protein family 5 domain-containing protein n=2 Tax=Litorilinea aerophila TaxID=1204385 RepID=A0A540VHJ1_9CHLR